MHLVSPVCGHGLERKEIQGERGHGGLKHALYTPGITKSTIDEVPEKFTVDKPEKAGPDGICVR